jgi:hypothetical protein
MVHKVSLHYEHYLGQTVHPLNTDKLYPFLDKLNF